MGPQHYSNQRVFAKQYSVTQVEDCHQPWSFGQASNGRGRWGGIFEISLNEFVSGDICFQQKVKVSQKKNKAHFHETRSFKSYLIRLKNNYIQGYSESRCNS